MELKLQNEKWYSVILLIPFLLIFFLLTIDQFFQKIAYTINIIIIGFLGIISFILFVISILAYLKTRKNKFYQIMIAFLFFFLNSILLALKLILELKTINVETMSNLFFLGALSWLLLPIIKKDGNKK